MMEHESVTTSGDLHRAEMVIKRRELKDRGFTEVGAVEPHQLQPREFFVEQTREGGPAEECWKLVRRIR